jgi:hypothetical protein
VHQDKWPWYTGSFADVQVSAGLEFAASCLAHLHIVNVTSSL